ncbi:MAG TPA: DnaB-like helicase C-terminal domain-containing protein, partial [Ktedonobacteraceae bacterium]|nr:DnaB-like helicase C-terminal domain-containing protein [Ktedonobacteraceae bacterium]
KSTLGMKMAMNIQEYGKRVLYLTFEQTVEEQERRLDAYRAGFNDNLLNSGQFNDVQYAALEAGIEMTTNLPAMMISQDCMTMSEVLTKADTFKPHVIIMDGVYMMDDERSGERNTSTALANIVASSKFAAMNREITIVAITQSTPARTKAEKLNADSVMGSRAFAQYANVLLGIERFESDKQFEHKMMRKLKILLSRSCPTLTVPLDWDYDKALFQENHDYILDEDGYNDPDEEESEESSSTPY